MEASPRHLTFWQLRNLPEICVVPLQEPFRSLDTDSFPLAVNTFGKNTTILLEIVGNCTIKDLKRLWNLQLKREKQ